MALAYGWGAGCGFGLGFLNFVGTVLFIMLLVWVVRVFLRGGFGWRASRCGGWHRGHRGRHSRRHGRQLFGDDALEEARARLARGEIGVEEYEKLRAALER